MKLPGRGIVVAVLCVVPSFAFAQAPPVESHRLVSIGVGGGVSVPIHDAESAFKQGVNAHGFLRFNLQQIGITPRLDVSFQEFDLKTATLGYSGTGQVLAGTGNLQMFLMHGPIQPYIVAGIGAYRFKTETDNTVDYTGNSESNVQFGINGGAGLIIKMGRLFSLYAEGRVDNMYTDKGLIETDQIQVVPVTFGIVY